jgi:hypothetical protein
MTHPTVTMANAAADRVAASMTHLVRAPRRIAEAVLKASPATVSSKAGSLSGLAQRDELSRNGGGPKSSSAKQMHPTKTFTATSPCSADRISSPAIQRSIKPRREAASV